MCMKNSIILRKYISVNEIDSWLQVAADIRYFNFNENFFKNLVRLIPVLGCPYFMNDLLVDLSSQLGQDQHSILHVGGYKFKQYVKRYKASDYKKQEKNFQKAIKLLLKGNVSVYSQRAIAGECIQIYKYDIIGYTVIWSGRRAGESYSMPEHDVTFTQSGLDAHKFEIKLYRNYQEESPPTIIVTYGAKFDIKIPIQGYDEYMFIGWVKLSGYCMLDKITTQERYTDNNGNGIKAWTDDRAYDLIVAYAKKTNTLVNKSYYNLYTITDDGRFEQNYDTLNIKQECGYSFGELYELGYRHICVNIKITVINMFSYI